VQIQLQSASEGSAKCHPAKKQRWELGVGYLERETFDACLQLPAPQRKLIREMILTFAKVHSESEAPSGKQ